MGKLYIVGTPIGNLGDFSPRAAETLEKVDFIAAEDTRVTLKLLNHFGIKKPMVSYFEHNQRARGEQIVERILGGESCAIVTDAGMPCISDPGEELVALCAQEGIDMEVVPGPSAAISALAVSGLPTGRFAFEGFLNAKHSARMEQLEKLKDDEHTLLFYAAPHKLIGTLEDMLQVLGDRRIAVVKELTKLHETVLRVSLREAVEYYRENSPRGEYVLVVEGAHPDQGKPSLEEAVEQVKCRSAEGESLSQAAKAIAAKTGYPKSKLYHLALESGRENEKGLSDEEVCGDFPATGE